MLGYNRPADPRDGSKPGLKPALYEPPGSVARPASPARPSPPLVAPPREGPAPTPPSPREQAPPAIAPAPAAPAPTLDPAETGSRLFIGVNIKLKGVEISDCDVLVIEGHVEATVHSKAMQIDKPGTLKGTALIDVAEIHGDFSGELTGRT